MNYFIFILILGFFSGSFSVAAETKLTFPILEAPFNFENSYSYPSMRQSLNFSTDFYQGIHSAIETRYKDGSRFKRIFLDIGFDIFSTWIPLGSAWVHEEWHRAVMMNRDINSFNDVYYFPILKDSIAVSHVEDQNLIRLKKEHPADQVRMSAAGMEAQSEQNLLINKSHFFFDAPTFDVGVLWMNTVGNIGYLATCGSPAADKSTDDQNISDGGNLKKRDFTGLDCNGWVYDLFRPDEPYTARGTHPSGVGIDRYIGFSDLSDEEKSFLQRQSFLSALSLIDPSLLQWDRFEGNLLGHKFEWNFNLKHYLTSFGYTVDANLFYRDGGRKFLFQLHNGFNNVRYFPGLTAEWLDMPLPWPKYSLTSHVTLWPQPKGQRYDATANTFTALILETLGYQWTTDKRFLLGFDAKTPGWIAGNVFLDKNFTLWTGFSLSI